MLAAVTLQLGKRIGVDAAADEVIELGMSIRRRVGGVVLDHNSVKAVKFAAS